MNTITVLVGQDLKEFYASLGVKVPANVYQVRVWALGDGQIKVKTNEGMWTTAFRLGEKDSGQA